MEDFILSMKKITKIYGNGIIANKDVDFSVRRGEIHALMGENGAGKSTLMKILFGEDISDSGDIEFKGKKVLITSPTDALRLGIGMVHQHFMLVPMLTVAENIFLGMELTHRGKLDRKLAVEKTEELGHTYHFNINPNEKISDLAVGTRQEVEILKALARGVDLLILDEPTAVLTPQETEELFKELKLFRKEGKTIIFISHKLKEVKSICDRITIMKKGMSVGTYELADMGEADISRLMIGHDVPLTADKEKANPGKCVLKIRDVICREEGKSVLNKVSLNLRSGEILGIAGVEGNGQQELAESLARLRQTVHGSITVNGNDITKKNIRYVREHGLSYLSDDRISEGTAPLESIEDNIVAGKMREESLTAGPFLNKKAIESFAKCQIDNYQIVCDSPRSPVGMLSGGNMQKVAVAREFSGKPSVMIVNQPTRGVDVGAMSFIHNKLIKLRDTGSAILLISADLSELMNLSDSLLVMFDGSFTAYFETLENISEEEIGYYMLGIKRQDKKDIERRLLRE